MDDKRAAPTCERFPNARRYRDFRRLLDKEANILLDRTYREGWAL